MCEYLRVWNTHLVILLFSFEQLPPNDLSISHGYDLRCIYIFAQEIAATRVL